MIISLLIFKMPKYDGNLVYMQINSVYCNFEERALTGFPTHRKES
jgi:hypothetical protein